MLKWRVTGRKSKKNLLVQFVKTSSTSPRFFRVFIPAFCTGCLIKEWSGRLASLDPSKRHLECRLCKAEVLLSTSGAVEELTSHFSAIPLVEIVRLQEQASNKEVTICQNCVDDETAVAYCSECTMFLCEFCEKYHKKTKATKDHHLKK